MPRVLFVHSSAQIGEIKKENQGSYTRRMARILRDSLKGRGVRFIERDVAAKPPGLIDNSFINAARIPEAERTPEQIKRLSESDELVGEVLSSDVIVVGCPVYNFGVPAPLKAWIDNIVRQEKTFTFGERANAKIIYGLLHNKMVVVLESSGGSGYQPGGSKEGLNHADRAITAVFEQLGVRKFATAVMEGVCEEDSEEIARCWGTCERQIIEIADRIKIRWRDQHRAG